MGYFRKDIALINAYGDEIITIKSGTMFRSPPFNIEGRYNSRN